MWSPLPASKPEWLLSAAQQCPCERLRLALRVHVEVRRPDPRCPAALGAASPDHISPARPADAACCSGSRHDHHTAYLARSRRGSGALTRPNFPTAGGRGRCGREDRTGGRRAAGRAQQPERPVLPAHRHLVRCLLGLERTDSAAQPEGAVARYRELAAPIDKAVVQSPVCANSRCSLLSLSLLSP